MAEACAVLWVLWGKQNIRMFRGLERGSNIYIFMFGILLDTIFLIIFCYLVIQVSTVTDQPGLQDVGASTGDLDEEDGGGLVNKSSVFVPLSI